MKVSEMMVELEMSRWHRLLFWAVNIPRHLLGMDIVVYPCMVGVRLVNGVKRIRIGTEK